MTTPHAPTYVYKNGFGKYYFRIAIPRKIRDITGKYEIRRSLKTTIYSIAVRRARRLAVTAETIFHQGTMKKRSKKDLKEFLNSNMTLHGPRVVNGVLQCDKIDIDSEKLDAEMAAYERISQQIVKDAANAPNSPTETTVTLDGPPPEVGGILLSELIPKYVQCQIDEGSWKEKTTLENQAIFDLLIRIMGDAHIQEITHDNSDSFRSTLLKLPPGINKSPDWKDLTIGQILELKPAKTLSPSSVNKYMRRISAMFNWAEDRDYILKNRFRKKKIKESKKANQRRDMLTGDDLAVLFSPQQFHAAADKPYKYWLPLIALYTGARQEEIASLNGEDILKIEGVWCFNFTTLKQKTPTKRIVPIHSKLQEFGLIEYAQSQPGKLFPELSKGRDGYGQTVSKWYARYRRSCGLTETRNKDFHSYRHTLSTMLHRAGVNSDLISEIDGHVTGNGKRSTTTQEVYIKDSEIKTLAEAIEKLNYGNPLQAVKPYQEIATP